MDSMKEKLKALWRQAHRTGKEIFIPCPSEKEAMKVRFALYNAAKAVRMGSDRNDPELKEAIENWKLVLQPTPPGVWITGKVDAGVANVIDSLLDPTSVVQARRTEEQKELDASALRVMERLQQAPTEAENALVPPPRERVDYTRVKD